jgi:murein DD-endopeptidase MepM/ murein hydrolase activator NlpD
MGILAAGLAGCSSESTRFGDTSFANPFASKKTAEVTGSVPAQAGRITAQPLPPPPNASRPATIAATGVSGQGVGPYAPGASTRPASAGGHDITGSASHPAWSWDGGTAVVVRRGDTVNSLARRYGVPPAAIVQANNLRSAAAIVPGQRVIIPRYNNPVAAKTAPHNATAKPSAPATTGSIGANIHVVAPGETLMSVARLYHMPLTELAAANKIAPHTLVKIGDRIVIPGRVAAAAPVAASAPAPVAAAPRLQPVVRAQAPAPQQVASIAPVSTARVAAPTAPANDDDEPVAVGSGGNGGPAFRWPVRGRVIAGFGAKPNGQQNDGINLAVPEGTAIRAAEDGVVAYAGNELKGYGNLILVRHANGFVTAYAHTSEIMVKRNDQVRRGQVIAKSGQSGTVTSPQLHFEIRKGSAPVDPTQYLPAG